MKDIYEVLYQKETDLARVRVEIDSLIIAARVLAEDDAGLLDQNTIPDAQSRKPAQKANSPESAAADVKLSG